MKIKTIVFIHGMFMTPLCWEHWVERYSVKGYTCLAPAWPERDKPVETLRNDHPDSELSKLRLTDVVDHIDKFIRTLDEKPVLIGHSMGGLVVQLLLQRDLAAAGVAIDPAPPQGVFTLKWSFIRANLPAIDPFLLNHPVLMTFKQFQYAFVNTLPEEEQRDAYDRYVVPESRRVPTQSLGPAGRVDFQRPHPPLLITAGERDHIIPPSLNRTNYERYSGASTVAFKEFPGRDHFLIGEPGWEEVADYCLEWLEKSG